MKRIPVEDRPAEAGTFGGYRVYVLILLMASYALSFIDRTIISTLAQPIKEDLHLSDVELGLLTGLSFALLYTVAGIPIARLAERRNRVRIVAASVAFWSLMTAVCGLSRNFIELLLARVGVGLGEAGGTPASQSILADYFPPERRGAAMAIFSMGIPLGVMFGAIASGHIAQANGWRAAFMIVGAPGILLAALILFTVRDPVRGGYDPPADGSPTPTMGGVLRIFLRRRSLLYTCMAGMFLSTTTYGLSSFYVPFLLRGFDLDLGTAASIHGITHGLTVIGMLGGGALADATAKWDRRFYAWLSAIGVGLAVPILIFGLTRSELVPVVALVGIANALIAAHLGPMWAVVHNGLEPRMRATGVAIFLLLFTLIGLGLGPLVVGGVSDYVARLLYDGNGAYVVACAAGSSPAHAALPDMAASCRIASFEGLRFGMVTIIGFAALAAVLFYLAGRTLRRDQAEILAGSAS